VPACINIKGTWNWIGSSHVPFFMELSITMKKRRYPKKYHEKQSVPIVRFFRWLRYSRVCDWHKHGGKKVEFSVEERKWLCAICDKAHEAVRLAKQLTGNGRALAIRAAEWELQQLYNRKL